MNQAKCGDIVKVHYIGRLKNGEIFSNTRDGDPLEFTLGEDQAIPGFENTVIGMEVGETKTIILPPEEAFGLRYEELVMDVKKSDFPDHINPVIRAAYG